MNSHEGRRDDSGSETPDTADYLLDAIYADTRNDDLLKWQQSIDEAHDAGRLTYDEYVRELEDIAQMEYLLKNKRLEAVRHANGNPRASIGRKISRFLFGR